MVLFNSLRRSARGFLLRHSRAARQGWMQLKENRLGSLLSLAMISSAASLLAMMVLALDVQHMLIRAWGGQPTITVFLQPDVGRDSAATLTQKLRGQAGVLSVVFESGSEAFVAFARDLGIATSAAETSPLPNLLVVTLSREFSARGDAPVLLEELQQRPEVARVFSDHRWLGRLEAAVRVWRRIVIIFGGVITLGTLLIVAGTTRTAVQQNSVEFVVMNLVGATRAQIRRPLIYAGMLLGLGSGLAAAGVVQGALMVLAAPVAELAGTYSSTYQLPPLSASFVSTLCLVTVAMGGLGARIGTLRRLEQNLL